MQPYQPTLCRVIKIVIEIGERQSTEFFTALQLDQHLIWANSKDTDEKNS